MLRPTALTTALLLSLTLALGCPSSGGTKDDKPPEAKVEKPKLGPAPARNRVSP